MKKVILVSLLVFFLASVSLASISENWDWRALKSYENQLLILAKIEKKENYEKDKPMVEIDKGLGYLYLLEAAYGAQLKPELKGIASYKEGGMEYYSIGLNIGTKEANRTFVLEFIYDGKSGEVIGYDVYSLPLGWYLTYFNNKKVIAVLNNDKDGFFFSLIAPLDAWVWVDNKIVKLEEK